MGAGAGEEREGSGERPSPFHPARAADEGGMAAHTLAPARQGAPRKLAAPQDRRRLCGWFRGTGRACAHQREDRPNHERDRGRRSGDFAGGKTRQGLRRCHGKSGEGRSLMRSRCTRQKSGKRLVRASVLPSATAGNPGRCRSHRQRLAARDQVRRLSLPGRRRGRQSEDLHALRPRLDRSLRIRRAGCRRARPASGADRRRNRRA